MPGESMRMLFTSQPASGHLRPLIPLARAARARGHSVAVATLAAMRDEVNQYGLDFEPVGIDCGADLFHMLPRGFRDLDYARAADALRDVAPEVTALWATTAARETAHGVIAHARDHRPDLIIREADEFGGYLAAEVIGVPHVSVASFGGLAEVTGPALGPALADGRAALGLAPDPAGDRLYPHLHATFVPREYGPEEFILPNTVAYQHTLMGAAGNRLPAWVAGMDQTLPFVFAGFGTVVYDLPGAREFLGEVIAALGSLPVSAVVAVGRGNPTDVFDPPPNVRLTDFVDQTLILQGCDLFVTHGGLGSVKDALALGVPMVGIGAGADHRHNIETLAAAGVGLGVDVHNARREELAAAFETVLCGTAFAARARFIARTMHALPTVETLLDDLEQLVDSERNTR